MDKLLESCNMLLMVGDFNVWVDVDGDNEVEILVDLLNSHGMTQTVHEPTHRGGHTLDHVYFNPYQMNIHHAVINENLDFTSDHFPIVLKIPSTNNRSQTRTVTHRKLKNMDLQSFRNDLKSAVDGIESQNMTFAEHTAEFDRECTAVVETHAPIVSWNVKKEPLRGWTKSTKRTGLYGENMSAYGRKNEQKRI